MFCVNSKNNLFKVFSLLFFVFSLGYPVIVYLGLRSSGVNRVSWLLMGVGLFQLVLAVLKGQKGFKAFVAPGCIFVLAGLSAAYQSPLFFKNYPFLVNLGLFVLFYGSLFQERSFIERVARLREPDLPAQGVRYTWWVTLVWAVYFFVNSFITLFTIYISSTRFWALYNGLIAYMLMGSLFAVELAIRTYLKRKWKAA